MSVYLDYNATTPVDIEVQEAVCKTLKSNWGNPSSSYSIGVNAKKAIEKARNQIADMINTTSDTIVFTSGGTESNNMVIQTVINNFYDEISNSSDSESCLPHIITSNIEHDSIKLPLKMLENKGKIKVTFVPVSQINGCIEVDDIINEVRPNTCLITVMLANNETGVIQPIELIRHKLDSLKRKNCHRLYIHTDAAQAIGKIEVDVNELKVDYLTIVGHKFYGPRVGALYFKRKCPLKQIFFGGPQENSYRPGTENTCMLVGLGKAAELITRNLEKYNKHMSNMRYCLEKCLKDTFCEKVKFNCSSNVPKLPNTVSVAFDFDNITGMLLLSKASGICASTGAACHNGKKSSSVLTASGVPEILASKTLRLSVGRETTKEDIHAAVEELKKALTNGK